MNLLDEHPAPWGWDDEDTAEPPYIHVYSDAGAVVCMDYRCDEERNSYRAFATFIVSLVNEATA